MALHFARSMQSQPVARLSLEALVYEVSSFDTPAGWDVALLDVYLLGEHHISDVFTGFADVGATTEHELVPDNAYCEVIHRVGVILPTHYFGGHVAGGAGRVLTVLCLPDLGNAHIRDPDVPCILHNQVLRFDVAVDHTLSVHILESANKAS